MDPIFLCDLALALGMPIGEMCDRMSAHELSVIWPAYYRIKAEEREAEEREQERIARRR
jgi:hypothetical protein